MTLHSPRRAMAAAYLSTRFKTPSPSSHRRSRYRNLPNTPHPSKSPNPPHPPTYMRSTIQSISTLLRSHPWSSAQSQLRLLPLRWDSFTVNQVLKTHPAMEKAWLFFNWAARLPGFKHDHYTYTTMLDIFGEAGRIQSMRHVFEEMTEKGIRIDTAVYTSVMHWLAKDGDFDGAVKAWEEMKGKGCRPTVVSYTAFMKVLFDYGRAEEAAQVFREMIEVGLAPNCHTYTVMMEYLAGAGNFRVALQIMDEMQEAGIQPDKAACNILIQKCSVAGEIPVMTQILHYMKKNSIVLRRPVYLEALQALKNSGQSSCLLREVNPHLSYEGMEDEVSEPPGDDVSLIDRGIVLNLLARRNFVAIDHVLRGMTDKSTCLDSELISAIVKVNCANYRPSGALMAFQYCLDTSRKLDKSVYISLIGLFIRTNSCEKVMEIVNEMVKAGMNLGTYHVSLLIYRFGCAGLSASAAQIFYSFPSDHNIVTYTALLNAYLKTGEVDKGLELYSRMRSQGVPVSSGMYEMLIVGLEEVGRTQDAEIYRKEKRKLEWHKVSGEGLSVEESLCNYLFDGGKA